MKLDEKKTIISWSLYDWANSAFATTVMAGFFPLFFHQYFNAGPLEVDKVVSNWRLGLANSAAGVTVAIMAPILGAVADQGSSKKKFLIFFAFLGVVMTVGLSLVARGHWVMAFWLYVFAVIGFSGGNIFYDSLITIVASEKKLDVVSAWGYSLGYLGGGVLLAFNVWMSLKPETFGLASQEQAVKVSFVTVGVWWAIFSVPIFLFVKEPPHPRAKSCLKMVSAGMQQLKQTFGRVRRCRTIFLFLLAYWLYIDGVDTIVRMAVSFGDLLKVDFKVLITSLLIVQFVGFPAAIGFGYLGQKIGARRGIFLGIAAYLFVTIWGALIKKDTDFYVLAVIIGLVQGGVQSLSRSFFARLIPVEQAAEFFGFYNMLGKFAVVLGPVLMGGCGLLLRAVGLDDETALRASIISIALMFIAGGALLYLVDENKGKEEARYLAEKT